MKLWWSLISSVQHKSKFNFELFEKKNLIFGFPWCSTREDLSIDVSITNVGLILTKLYSVISFLGVRTDERTDRQTRFWNPHMETCWHTKNSTQSSKWGVSCRSLYTYPDNEGAYNYTHMHVPLFPCTCLVHNSIYIYIQTHAHIYLLKLVDYTVHNFYQTKSEYNSVLRKDFGMQLFENSAQNRKCIIFQSVNNCNNENNFLASFFF